MKADRLPRRGWVWGMLWVFVTLWAGVSFAQTPTPNYQTSVRTEISADGQTLTIFVTVTNTGAIFRAEVPAYLVRYDDGSPQQLGVLDVPSLPTNTTSEPLIFTTALGGFYPAGSRQMFGVQLVPPVGTAGTFEGASFALDIPAVDSSNSQTSPPPPIISGGGGNGGNDFMAQVARAWQQVQQNGTFTLPLTNIEIDLNDPQQQMILLVIAALGILSLLLILRLWRLIFDRPPAFGTWQPPYAVMPHVDPYSTSGIRQGWQAFAQSNLITQPPVPDTAQSVKVLTGTDGVYLSGWQVLALRITLYDQYGRVTRTQVLGAKKTVRRLNRLAQRRAKLTPQRAERALKPLARAIAKQFRRKLTARNAILPAALDIRLRGRHGEVSIWFELYQNHQGIWQQVDRWQPEMYVSGKMIYESYTYTVFGIGAGESLREYKQRLPDDILRWLLAFLAVPQTVQERLPAPPMPQATPPPADVSPQPPAEPTPPPSRRRPRVGGRSPVVFEDTDDSPDADDHTRERGT